MKTFKLILGTALVLSITFFNSCKKQEKQSSKKLERNQVKRLMGTV